MATLEEILMYMHCEKCGELYHIAKRHRCKKIKKEIELPVTPKTADCVHLAGVEYQYQYDGVWDWACIKHDKKQCRWKLYRNGQRKCIDDKAIDKLCKGCLDYDNGKDKK